MTRARAVGAIAVASLVVFAVYVVGLDPSVGWFDGGELVVAAHRLGSSHPPGQPTHALVTKAFLFLPFGDIGFRANLVSAAFGALAAFLVGLLVLWVSLRLASSAEPQAAPPEKEGAPRPLGFLVPKGGSGLHISHLDPAPAPAPAPASASAISNSNPDSNSNFLAPERESHRRGAVNAESMIRSGIPRRTLRLSGESFPSAPAPGRPEATGLSLEILDTPVLAQASGLKPHVSSVPPAVLAAALAAAIAFSLSPFALEQAVRAEVYSLELALALAVAAFLFAPSLTVGQRLAAAAFVTGIGAGVHPPLSAVWALVLFLCALAHHGRDLFRPNRIAPLFVALVLGCAVLIYLPLAVRNGGFSWGRPNTAAQFFDVLTVRAYRSNFAFGGGDPGEPLAIIGSLLTAGTSVALVIAAALGAVALSIHRSRLGIGVLISFFLSILPLFANRVIWPENPDFRGYLLLPVALIFLVASIAAALISTRLRAAPLRRAAAIVPIALAATALTSFGLPKTSHAPPLYAREVVERLPEHALALFSSDHAVFLALYAQEVENRRPDVVFAASGLLDSSWVVDRIRRATPPVLTPFVDFVAPRAELGEAWLKRNAMRRPIAFEDMRTARSPKNAPATCDGLVCLAQPTPDHRGAEGIRRFFAETDASRDASAIAYARRLRIVRAIDATASRDPARAIDWLRPDLTAKAVTATISHAATSWPFTFPLSAVVPPRRIGNDFVSSPAEPHRVAGNLLAWLGIPSGDGTLLRAMQLGSVDACIDLAGLTAMRGDAPRATQIVAECVTANERHAATLRQNAGVAFANAGHLADAEREFRESLRLIEAGLGVNEISPEERTTQLVAVLTTLARIRFDRGDRLEADELRDRARQILGTTRP